MLPLDQVTNLPYQFLLVLKYEFKITSNDMCFICWDFMYIFRIDKKQN